MNTEKDKPLYKIYSYIFRNSMDYFDFRDSLYDKGIGKIYYTKEEMLENDKCSSCTKYIFDCNCEGASQFRYIALNENGEIFIDNDSNTIYAILLEQPKIVNHYRVTIDEDSHHKLIWVYRILRGYWFIRKRPDYIRTTERGIHLIWRNVTRTEKEAMELRKKIRDDPKRMELDENSKRQHQVLFCDKTTKQLEKIHPTWFRIIKEKPIKIDGIKHYEICPACYKGVICSYKIWEESDPEYYLDVDHGDYHCQYVIEKRNLPWIINMLHKNKRY